MPHGYTYLLKCSDGSFYPGSTVDIERWLWEHQNLQEAIYTKNRQPLKLVYFEEYDRIDIAFYSEKQIQGWSHKKKKALIDGQPELLPQLTKKIFRVTGCFDTSR